MAGSRTALSYAAVTGSTASSKTHTASNQTTMAAPRTTSPELAGACGPCLALSEPFSLVRAGHYLQMEACHMIA